MAIKLKEKWEIEIMKQAGETVKKIFKEIVHLIKPGVTTLEIDEAIKNIIYSDGGKPTFLNYRGFPKHSCISLDHEVVHGIPSNDRKIENGSLLKIDVGVTYNGYIADAARTFKVGQISNEVCNKLVEVCSKALEIGIETARPFSKLGDIGTNIEKYVTNNKFSVVKQYVGHGVGKILHEDPQVPNFSLNPDSYYYNYQLKPGLCIAIEPMVNEGVSETYTLEDGWTVVTQDHKLSAHFEDTIAITEDGVINLTR
ncbi:MAG: type I methionyl aminopeptidase [Planctomycetes bacterium]|nr:type I methionyl aminopeptidase [Planctomycetota bacterium]